jgi:hypothetical protein
LSSQSITLPGSAPSGSLLDARRLAALVTGRGSGSGRWSAASTGWDGSAAAGGTALRRRPSSGAIAPRPTSRACGRVAAVATDTPALGAGKMLGDIAGLGRDTTRGLGAARGVSAMLARGMLAGTGVLGSAAIVTAAADLGRGGAVAAALDGVAALAGLAAPGTVAARGVVAAVDVAAAVDAVAALGVVAALGRTVAGGCELAPACRAAAPASGCGCRSAPPAHAF